MVLTLPKIVLENLNEKNEVYENNILQKTFRKSILSSKETMRLWGVIIHTFRCSYIEGG